MNNTYTNPYINIYTTPTRTNTLTHVLTPMAVEIMFAVGVDMYATGIESHLVHRVLLPLLACFHS